MADNRANLPARFGLNERQGDFVRLVAAGLDPKLAYAQSGYSGSELDAQKNALRLLRQPNVAAALHSEIARHLATDAALARRVAVEILQDQTVSPKVRADLAVKMLRLAGHVEPRAALADNGPVKTLSEMSTEELRARAAQLEDEIAARAKPIRASDAPADPQATDIFD